jgi:glutathione S-transferase
MSLKLYSHPLASYCQKALIAFYENGTPFEPVLVDFGDEASAAAFRAVWPVAKMPVLRDEARDLTIPEATIVIEYLDHRYPGERRFLPADPDLAWQTRLRDRFYDLHVQEHMQKVVADRLRPAGQKDAPGVETARARLAIAYDWIEGDMEAKTWAMGEAFTLADCSAAPALFYANLVAPFGEEHPNTTAYLDRLMQRPSFARVVEEAAPFMSSFPKG